MGWFIVLVYCLGSIRVGSMGWVIRVGFMGWFYGLIRIVYGLRFKQTVFVSCLLISTTGSSLSNPSLRSTLTA